MIYNGMNITLTLDTNHNISSPTISRIYYKKPSGETGYWDATVIGSDLLRYITLNTDINIPGVWTLQGYVLKDGIDHWTSIAEMIVEAHI